MFDDLFCNRFKVLKNQIWIFGLCFPGPIKIPCVKLGMIFSIQRSKFSFVTLFFKYRCPLQYVITSDINACCGFWKSVPIPSLFAANLRPFSQLMNAFIFINLWLAYNYIEGLKCNAMSISGLIDPEARSQPDLYVRAWRQTTS